MALAGISAAAPLTRLSASPALTIAAWRLGLALIVVAAALLLSGEWRQWRRLAWPEWRLAMGGGVALALHFWAWNRSLQLTTVAASAVLVNVHPIIVAVLSARLLGERPTRRAWAGIAVALLGAMTIAVGDAAAGAAARGALAGDLLALLAAVMVALYYLVGRRLRPRLELWAYVGVVYGVCFLVLLLLAALAGAPLAPLPPREIALFAGLALGPMLLGHTGLNWALRYLPAYVVGLTVLGEPVGATLLAAALPGIREIPPGTTLLGGALVLAGIALAFPRPR